MNVGKAEKPKNNIKSTLEHFLQKSQAQNKTTDKEGGFNSNENVGQKFGTFSGSVSQPLGEIRSEGLKAFEDIARKIFKEEFEKKSARLGFFRDSYKKGKNERVAYIRVGTWLLVQKFRKTANEPVGDILDRMAKAAVLYLEQAGNLNALEDVSDHPQNSNRKGGGPNA